MAAPFTVTISTFDKSIYKGEATSLIAPGEGGYLGVLAHHAPLITPLKPGNIALKTPDGKEVFIESSGDGFMEVARNNATLLLDSVREK